MWHTINRKSHKYQLASQITSFVPLEANVELMHVEIMNTADTSCMLTPVAAIPIYGRSADNVRDHRHVTSLLHRIATQEYGVTVKPTMSFDERGHRKNHQIYFALGVSGEGKAPAAFYPTVEQFIGEGGTYTHPRAVLEQNPGVGAGTQIEGKEAFGGIRFDKIILQPGQKTDYLVILGVTEDEEQLEEIVRTFDSTQKVMDALRAVQEYWQNRVNVKYHTGSKEFDNFLRWVSFQPMLRRIYGCSFLPHHDYGRGGRGWRDLWQDCLALLVMEPDMVRKMIVSNYGGVRIDGTNATIIGNGQGEFIADRNNITRVWMDHAYWPFVTTKLYIDQTGDLDIFLDKVSYFKDRQSLRGMAHDDDWKIEYGNTQKTVCGADYFGTVIEHILLQNLCAFYDVGEHNEMRLHGADWNDALDMAWERGESVAFTCAYAGNLKEIAECLRELEQVNGINRIEMAEEMKCLFAEGDALYESPEQKQRLLSEYTDACLHNISGNTIILPVEQVVKNLEAKAEWMMQNIREHEWIAASKELGWFNGYYDNNGNPVERCRENDVRMMLTGQVFAIMSGTASKEQVAAISKSADTYLFDEKAGGYRLNTDFKEEKFDLGRMFGFAYGEKENGAVFSHMAIMYANALYKRGFAREGYKVLHTLLNAAMKFENSRMYPGLPEYFDNEGRGLYAYLTGAASWYMLTMITEVFGVRGKLGDMVIKPSLMPEEFDPAGNASVKLEFSGKKFELCYHKTECQSTEQNRIRSAVCDGTIPLEQLKTGEVLFKKCQIESLSLKERHKIELILD